jgi:hypothetical protein
MLQEAIGEERRSIDIMQPSKAHERYRGDGQDGYAALTNSDGVCVIPEFQVPPVEAERQVA